MNFEVLLFLLVCVTAVALLLQSYSMWQTSRSITAMVERLDSQSRELEHDARRLMGRIQNIVESLAPLGTIAENLKTNVETVTHMVRERAQDLDQFAQEITEMGREQADRVNYLVTDTAQKFERTTEMIQQEVVRPVVEISSFLKGVKAGLSYLFSNRGSANPTRSQPEEQLFI